jgi:hypothetical protein
MNNTNLGPIILFHFIVVCMIYITFRNYFKFSYENWISCSKCSIYGHLITTIYRINSIFTLFLLSNWCSFIVVIYLTYLMWLNTN